MRSKQTYWARERIARLWVVCVGMVLLLSLSLSVATAGEGTPRDPLLAPYYSFDRDSPSVRAGIVPADAILACNDECPVVVVTPEELGLGRPLDDINAMSMESAGMGIDPTAPIAVLFSVDRATVGAVPPDPLLVANSNVPYNVQDQAAKGHAAGDQYISTDVFLLSGTIAGVQALGSGSNNSEVRNNFDAGGTNFGADPKTSPSSSGSPADDVNGTSGTAAALAVAGADSGVIYLSLRTGSESLHFLDSGGVSGSAADIYVYVPQGTSPPLPPGTTLYASAANLGLLAGDDISAMVVFERDGAPGFGGGDEVVFSLAPGSESILQGRLPNATDGGAAGDVYVADASGGLRLLASASNLGLGPLAGGGQSPDNVNALDLLNCSDGVGCAIAHGIQTVTIPTVSEWGLVAFVLAVMTAGTVLVRRSRVHVV